MPTATAATYTHEPVIESVTGYPRDPAWLVGSHEVTLRIAAGLTLRNYLVMTADYADFGYRRCGQPCPIHGWRVEYVLTDARTGRTVRVRLVHQMGRDDNTGWAIVVDHDPARRLSGFRTDPELRWHQGNIPDQLAQAIDRAIRRF
ncbi:hypothetical protein [Embleya sp. NPDC005971]|uniref:hypothetical protein n=1 Tax=Embleya sp. NPDC005971 TaxID=3156724 RepID=UPI003403F210